MRLWFSSEATGKLVGRPHLRTSDSQSEVALSSGLPRMLSGEFLYKLLNCNDLGSRTCKPNSVHLAVGRPFLWAVHYCAALATYPKVWRAEPARVPPKQNFLPIWSCSVWGLPCPQHCCRGGALLPHLFTLTPLPL